MSLFPKITVVAPNAAPEEAAAIVAALELFTLETSPARRSEIPTQSRWQIAALHEGVAREFGDAPAWT